MYDHGPTDSERSQLSVLLTQLVQTEDKIAQLELEVSLEKERKRILVEEDIPDLMDSSGTESHGAAGIQVTIKDDVRAHVSKERIARAVKWLDENGHGGIVKRLISVAFTRDQEDKAAELVDRIKGDYPVKQDWSIHAGTLKAWATRRIEAEEDFPKDLFGIQERRVAKIKRK